MQSYTRCRESTTGTPALPTRDRDCHATAPIVRKGTATFLAAQDPRPLGWTPCPWGGRAQSFRFNVAGRWEPAMSERDLLEVQPTHAPHVHPPLQGVRSPDCGGRANRGRGRGDCRRTRRGVLRTPRHPTAPGSLDDLRGRSGGLTGRRTREDEGDRAVVTRASGRRGEAPLTPGVCSVNLTPGAGCRGLDLLDHLPRLQPAAPTLLQPLGTRRPGADAGAGVGR